MMKRRLVVSDSEVSSGHSADHKKTINELTQNIQDKLINERKNCHTEQHRKSKTNPYRWIQYLIYLWAMRLGLQLLGFTISLSVGIAYLMGVPLSEMDGIKVNDKDLDLVDMPVLIWKDAQGNKRHIIKSKFGKEPFIITGTPFNENGGNVHDFIEVTLRSLKSKVKVSNSSHFAYFASDRVWSNQFTSLISYDTNSWESVSDIRKNNCVEMEVDRSSCQYWYLSQAIPKSIQDGWINKISSPYARFLRLLNAKDIDHSSSEDMNILLWLASDNVTVHAHYDMESNIFLQLTGSKTFQLASPNLFRKYKPYSSYHPLWRQVQHDIEPYTEGRKDVVNVTLQAGDILHIPPFYFHKVFTRLNSSSTNAWMRSSPSNIYDRLLRIVPLPFDTKGGREEKLACLGVTARRSIEGIESIENIRDFILTRHGIEETNTLVASPSNNKLGGCSELITLLVQEKDSIDRTVKKVLSLLNSDADLNKSIQIQLILDYIDEIFAMIMKEDTTVSSAQTFVKSCMLQEYG